MRNFCLVCLSLIFLGLFCITSFLNGLSRVFLNSENVKKTFAEIKPFSKLIDLAVDSYFSEPSNINGWQGGLIFVSKDLVKDVANRVISSDWSKGELNNVIDYFFSILSGDNIKSKHFIISLEHPKYEISKNLQILLQKKIENLPQCSSASSASILKSSGIPSCLPNGYTASDILKSISSQNFVATVPDEIDLTFYILTSPFSGEILSSINLSQQLYRFFQLSIIFLYAVLAAVFASFFLISNSVKQAFRWAGMTLSLSAVSFFALIICWRYYSLWFFQTKVSLTGTPVIKQLIEEFLKNSNNQFYLYSILICGIFLLAGLIVYFLSFFFKKNELV